MDVCDQWNKNPLINPRSGRRIKLNGPTYAELERECSDYRPLPKSPVTSRRVSARCQEWFDNPLKNPLTSRPIKKDGTVYAKLRKECGDPGDKGSQSPDRGSITKPLTPPSRVPKTKKVRDIVQAPWSLNSRIATAMEISKSIRLIPEHQFDICMSGPKSVFRQNLGTTKLIGQGCFGEVYLTLIAGKPVVVKEAYMTPAEKKLMVATVSRKSRIGDINKASYPLEYTLSTFVNGLLDSHSVQNFLYTYSLAACEGCKILNDTSKTPKFCYITFMEAADRNLSSIEPSTLSDADAYNFVLQLLAALSALHGTLGLFHTDIKLDNVLVKCVQPGGYYEYNIGSNRYYIENRGYILTLADFGASMMYKPRYLHQINADLIRNQKDLGTRNAAVEIDANGVEYWKPIICKYALFRQKGKAPKLKPAEMRQQWITKTGQALQSTYNLFYDTLNLMPNIPVDLNDTLKFPPFEFGLDIIDVFRLMVGGKRAFQPGDHFYLFDHSIPHISCIAQQRFNVWGGAPRNIYGTVSMVRADLMLRDLYTALPSPRVTHVLDTFNV